MQSRDELKNQLILVEREKDRLLSELRSRRTYLDLMRRLMRRGAEHIVDDEEMDRLITSLIAVQTLYDQLARTLRREES
ncbi:hypothetical protein AAGS40_25065 (plasmid) [Paraburkholderia sp. PREW-6R]|uniref:hypothetical protein n=1 Tax=Paraburkholderia sp. PREW-6R TaxID=3141544 RepID=UPI0031F5CE27